jgi:hypothetical protein
MIYATGIAPEAGFHGKADDTCWSRRLKVPLGRGFEFRSGFWGNGHLWGGEDAAAGGGAGGFRN